MDKIKIALIGLIIGFLIGVACIGADWYFDYGYGWLLEEGIFQHPHFVNYNSLYLAIISYPIFGLFIGYLITKFNISSIGIIPFVLLLTPITVAIWDLFIFIPEKFAFCGTERLVADSEVFAFLSIVGFISIVLFSNLYKISHKIYLRVIG